MGNNNSKIIENNDIGVNFEIRERTICCKLVQANLTNIPFGKDRGINGEQKAKILYAKKNRNNQQNTVRIQGPLSYRGTQCVVHNNDIYLTEDLMRNAQQRHLAHR